ncbi:CPXCG motif-containing cysteine-rich protein [Wenzhouxiangella sp. XN201]|uniref:CPXCG motif-containing cysteine-rich protein n=1 Tax=Wenzhouxiangella sp. XN201 TaxID=2710755 RepID=UPI001969BF8B|nr:CPXCG motif-containing cysteine-rich protein [Wenzhouxiangella sp. XN201]
MSFACPWCGEHNELPLDPGEFGQQVVMDCAVCCRPIEIDLPADGEGQPAIRGEGQ